MPPPTVSDGADPPERFGKACAPTVIAAKVKQDGSRGQGIRLKARVESFFEAKSNTITYLVWDDASLRAAVVDPVLDFTLASGTASTSSIDAILDRAGELKLTIDWCLETHVHADHLSAAQRVKARTGAKIVIGSAVREVHRHFAPMFGFDPSEDHGFDWLVEDGDKLALGELEIEVLHVPGHTPADVAYLIGDALFVGDTLFMPDFGTARCDFPGGCARKLYASIQRLLALPGDTRMFLCHDYKAPGRDEFAWETTVGEQRRANVHVGDGKGEAEFVAMRGARDSALPVPAMLLPALQVNIRGGRMPDVIRVPVTWSE
jgi:glyoxylase-like metal-dependent hydrolase (beta-lactamase superfamily II)